MAIAAARCGGGSAIYQTLARLRPGIWARIATFAGCRGTRAHATQRLAHDDLAGQAPRRNRFQLFSAVGFLIGGERAAEAPIDSRLAAIGSPTPTGLADRWPTEPKSAPAATDGVWRCHLQEAD
jgi:hypothetical protein